MVPIATILLSSFASIGLAQHDHGGHSGHSGSSAPAPQVRTGKEKGRVMARDENSLTLETSKKGKRLEKTFFLSSETQWKGQAQSGSDVEIKFRQENGRLLATSIAVK